MAIKIGQKVWDNLLKRYDEIEAIYTTETKTGKVERFKLYNHTSTLRLDEMSKEEGCSCPFPKNDGSPFDGVSYHCPKHGR